MQETSVVNERGAAKILGLARQSLANQRHMGVGAPYVKLRGRIVYKVSDLLAYLDRHRIDPEARREAV